MECRGHCPSTPLQSAGQISIELREHSLQVCKKVIHTVHMLDTVHHQELRLVFRAFRISSVQSLFRSK